MPTPTQPLTLPAPLPCLQGATKFASALGEAAAGAGSSGAALALPEPQYLEAVSSHRGGGHKSLTRAAADPQLVAAFAAALGGWCGSVEQALRGAELAAGKDADDAGGCWGLGGAQGLPSCLVGRAGRKAAANSRGLLSAVTPLPPACP